MLLQAKGSKISNCTSYFQYVLIREIFKDSVASKYFYIWLIDLK